MSQKQNLSEAAKQILQGNRDTEIPKGEKFGLNKKLNDTVDKNADKIGNANFAEYDLNDVPTATAPGITGVGSEKLDGGNENNKKVAKELKASPAEVLANYSTPKQFPPKGVNENDDDELATNEDIEALMAGENLSEEFKRKATAIFESAVKVKVAELAEELEAQYITQFEEAYEEMKEDFESKIDNYLDYVVENWMDDNKLAVESGIRTEIAEGFMESLKTVFEEHYIDIPEEKFDVVESLASKVEQLEKQVNEEMHKNISLKQKLSEQKKLDALNTVCEGLTLSQTEKIKSIAENVEFFSEDDFVAQMEDIKESYFSSNVKPASKESLYDYTPLNEEKEVEKVVDPVIASYASTISKTLLK